MGQPPIVHPGGEDVLGFETYAGKVSLSVSDERLTPFGGLVPWSAFVRKSGVFERLAESCPVRRTSPNASRVYDVLQSFALAVLCDGRRFSHVNRLRDDAVLTEVFGMEKVVGDDTVRRLFREVGLEEGRAWVAGASGAVARAVPEGAVLDWDSTVQTKYGNQEGAEVGYNPQKRGRRSFHPLVAVVGGTRLAAHYSWRPGDSPSAGGFGGACEEALEWCGGKVWLNRGDVGFAGEEVCRWHEEDVRRPHYLFRLKLTANVKRAIARVAEGQWMGKRGHGVLQVAEVELRLSGWSEARRVVVGRRLRGEVPGPEAGEFWGREKHEFEAYVTSLPAGEADAWQCVELYRGRADCENVFDEVKNQWGFNGFCSQSKEASALAARLLLLVYNLWNLFLRLLEPGRHVEMVTGRRSFLLIAGRLTKSGRTRGLQISVGKDWWEQLGAGYNRLAQWLSLTAAQLDLGMPPPDGKPGLEHLAEPPNTLANCGI